MVEYSSGPIGLRFFPVTLPGRMKKIWFRGHLLSLRKVASVDVGALNS